MTAVQRKKPTWSRTLDIAKVEMMVIAALETMITMRCTSGRPVRPSMRVASPPRTAGTSSWTPLGLQITKVTVTRKISKARKAFACMQKPLPASFYISLYADPSQMVQTVGVKHSME